MGGRSWKASRHLRVPSSHFLGQCSLDGQLILRIISKIGATAKMHQFDFRWCRPGPHWGSLSLNIIFRNKNYRQLEKAAQGKAQCEVSAYARSCRRCVATYWKVQTRRAQNCKYLRQLSTDLKTDFTMDSAYFSGGNGG